MIDVPQTIDDNFKIVGGFHEISTGADSKEEKRHFFLKRQHHGGFLDVKSVPSVAAAMGRAAGPRFLYLVAALQWGVIAPLNFVKVRGGGLILARLGSSLGLTPMRPEENCRGHAECDKPDRALQRPPS